MGHIVIDIEETPADGVTNKVLHYDNNATIIKELEAEVYQNGYLAGYVLADMNLYQNEIQMEGCDVNGSYLTEVRKFISQHYLDLLHQFEKTYKKVSKLWEVVQYGINDIQNNHLNADNVTVCKEMDQVFMIIYNIYKQLILFEHLKDMKLLTKDEELLKTVKNALNIIIQQCFVCDNSNKEVVCLGKSLPKICEEPIVFNDRTSESSSENSETIPLKYDRARDIYCIKISGSPSRHIILTTNICLANKLRIPIEIKCPLNT